MQNQLHNSSICCLNFKGGSGKTVLAGNIASIATVLFGWTVLVVDLDSSAPMTRLAFERLEEGGNVTRALELLRENSGTGNLNQALAGMIRYVPSFGFWLLPGTLQVLSQESCYGLYDLIDALKSLVLSNGQPVDLVLVDAPGENQNIYNGVMSVIDQVIVPLAFTATDYAATARSLKYIQHFSRLRADNGPAFLGVVPNRILKNDASGAHYLKMILSGNQGQPLILPYVPHSRILASTYVRKNKAGYKMPVYVSRHNPGTRQLIRLVEALADPDRDYAVFSRELAAYVGLDMEGIAE